MEKLNELFWINLPARMGRRMPSLAATLADGGYLATWANIGALVPVAAFVAGAVLATAQPGYTAPANTTPLHYLYSWPTLVAMVIVSQHGAALGAVMWLGYAIGDLTMYLPPAAATQVPWTSILAARILADVVLLALLVGIPRSAASLARSTAAQSSPFIAKFMSNPGYRLSDGQAIALRVGLHAAVSGYLIYLWTQTASLLLQPVYRWSGLAPMTHGLAQAWEANGLGLAVLAAYCGGARALVESRVGLPSAVAATVVRLVSVSRTTAQIVAGAIARAAMTTLILAGMVTTWGEVAALFAFFSLAFVAISMMAARALQPGAGAMDAVPVLVRFAVALIVLNVVSAELMAYDWSPANGFAPAQLMPVAGLVVFALLLPTRTWKASPTAVKVMAVGAAVLCVFFIPVPLLAGDMKGVKPKDGGFPTQGGAVKFGQGAGAGAGLMTQDAMGTTPAAVIMDQNQYTTPASAWKPE